MMLRGQQTKRLKLRKPGRVYHVASGHVFYAARDNSLEGNNELQQWIVRESGSIGPKAGFELHVAANECFEASALATRAYGQVLRSEEPRLSFARRLPAGVVGVIAPFNVPLILSIRSVAPALALGNAVLLKPDPRTDGLKRRGDMRSGARVFETDVRNLDSTLR